MTPEFVVAILAVILQIIQIWQNRKPRYKGRHRKR